jgi:HTH-type transcriptional regulator, global nitrogen regulator NrpRI
MVDIATRRKMIAILRILREAPGPLGSKKIDEELRMSGLDLSERTIRNYLAKADDLGWTVNLGRRGRRMTDLGIQEVDGALVTDKVGFVAARMDELSFAMDYDPAKGRGKVIANVATVARQDFRHAVSVMKPVYRAGLSMGKLVAFRREGETLGSYQVPAGRMAFGTVCSVSVNGLLLKAGIAVVSKFGGLLEMQDGQPKRFVEIIHYEGTSLDPLEIFIRSRMTRVMDASLTGTGIIGASFREVPSAALHEVRRLTSLSEHHGMSRVLAVGRPNQSLLDIPVAQGKTGLVVCGGMNPVAAMVESDIPVSISAMSCMVDMGELVPFNRTRDYV